MKKKTMVTRLDPTRTTMLRRAFGADMSRRFRNLRREVDKLLVEDDALGLGTPVALHAKRVFRFETDEGKLQGFRDWLQERIDAGVLSTDSRRRPWTEKYIESAYRKGNLRAYTDSLPGRRARAAAPGVFEGSQKEFLRSAFGAPEQLAKVEHLATRTLEQLRGVTSDMAAKMNRALSDGIVQGQNPRQIARVMAKQVEGISRSRALTIARTEVIHAHAEGQLDSFQDLGVKEVGAFVEWSTAEDEDVCPLCKKLEGAVFTIAEARGKLPRHPNCRCAWVPAVDVKAKGRRDKMLRRVSGSLKLEGGTRKSTWAGKLLVRKKRRK